RYKTFMKIGILSRSSKIYSTRRLVEAAKARGHQVKVYNPLKCYMNITSGKPTVHYDKQQIEKLDAVIPRIGASITSYGSAVLRQFEVAGVYAANESVAYIRARDKL